MQVRTFETTLGDVPVWGDCEGFSRDRLLLLVIRGAFSGADQLFGISEAFPNLDVAYVQLPGMHSPYFARDSVHDFAAAFDQVLTALGHERVAVLGVSLGGAVAMALRHPGLRALLLVDTPLSTAAVWVLPLIFRPRIEADARLARWIWDLFGVSQTEVVNRDYRPLVQGLPAKALVLIGGVPLAPPRPVTQAPSAVSDEDRAVYLAHPLIRVELVPGAGHNIPLLATATFVRALRRVVAASG